MSTTVAEALLTPTVTIAGRALTADWVQRLVEVRVERQLSLVGRAMLRFTDHDYTLVNDSSLRLGHPLTVATSDGDQLFEGDITAVGVEQDNADGPQLVVVVHDRGYRLGRASTAKVLQNVADADVVSQLASDNGLQAQASGLDTTTHPYLLQAETGLAMLDAVAARNGCDWWVDGDTIHVAAPSDASTVNLSLSNGLLTFSVRVSGLYPSKVTARGWDPDDKQAVLATVEDGNPLVTDAALVSQLLPSGTQPLREGALLVGGATPFTQAEATAVATGLRNRALIGSVEARCTALGSAALKPGVAVKLSEIGPAAGTYHVSRVEHVYRRFGFETRLVAGDRRPGSLVDTLGAAAPTGRYPGVVVGVITDNNDEEHAGRVKVKFPLLGDQIGSAWARISTVGGGDQRGVVFLPEVDDEVLVAFESGDLRRPVVIGGLHNKDKSPTQTVTGGRVVTRRITSRVGHVLEFSDGDAEASKHVQVQLSDNQTKLRVGEDKLEVVTPSGNPVTITSGASKFEIGQDGSITIKGSKVTITGDQGVTVESSGQTVVKGTTASVQGSAQAEVKGPTTQVSGDGALMLKGGVVKIN